MSALNWHSYGRDGAIAAVDDMHHIVVLPRESARGRPTSTWYEVAVRTGGGGWRNDVGVAYTLEAGKRAAERWAAMHVGRPIAPRERDNPRRRFVAADHWPERTVRRVARRRREEAPKRFKPRNVQGHHRLERKGGPLRWRDEHVHLSPGSMRDIPRRYPGASRHNGAKTLHASYTRRARDGRPSVTWRAELDTIGTGDRLRWVVDLWRNGHEFATNLDPDDVRGAIAQVEGRDASMIARKLLAPLAPPRKNTRGRR